MSDALCIRGRIALYDVALDVFAERPVRPLTADELVRFASRGFVRKVRERDNLVVDLGLSAISRLVGFGLATPNVTNSTQSFGVTDVNDLQITSMAFGNLNAPTAPTAADFELEDTTALTTVVPTVTYPTNYSVRWSGVIPADTFTGSQITEEALFCANGALFARTTFTASAIVSGFGKQLDHDFTFSRV